MQEESQKSIPWRKAEVYGAMIYLGVYLDTLLSEVVLRPAVPTDTRDWVSLSAHGTTGTVKMAF